MTSPKTRFLATPHAPRWVDVVVSEAYQAATESAMLQFVNSLSDTLEAPTADAAYQRILGARAFLAVLTTIADPAKSPPAKPTSANLDHTVR